MEDLPRRRGGAAGGRTGSHPPGGTCELDRLDPVPGLGADGEPALPRCRRRSVRMIGRSSTVSTAGVAASGMAASSVRVWKRALPWRGLEAGESPAPVIRRNRGSWVPAPQGQMTMTVDPSRLARLAAPPEGWQSGRMRRSRKPLGAVPSLGSSNLPPSALFAVIPHSQRDYGPFVKAAHDTYSVRVGTGKSADGRSHGRTIGARDVAKTDYTVLLVATAAMPSLKTSSRSSARSARSDSGTPSRSSEPGTPFARPPTFLTSSHRPSVSTSAARSGMCEAPSRAQLDAAVEPLAQGRA